MEGFGLRRTQSLKSLSGVQERSWVMPAPTHWDRKSVSQLVQHYQSCADLRSIEKEQHKLQASDSCADDHWRTPERGDSVALWGSGRTSNLCRSRSMDFLPQRESSGTRALCALFESKATQQESFSSSPRLNSASAAGRHCPLQDWRSHSMSLKGTLSQRTAKVEGGQAMNGLPESHDRSSRYSHDDKYSPSLKKGGTPTRQSRDRISTSSSVRDRSALYLSRAAAIDSTGGSTQPEIVNTPGTRAKNSKFGLPAKDMCSACLTPVYPMEKMVANKLVLHKNCFCCKHCQKKLSIHNYSSLYGEFYCIHHYQQLFKRTGNYDEGFGHKQHKDLWLKKDKGIDEPEAAPTAKITKSNLSMSDGSRESSTGVNITKSNVKELGYSGADVKGKLKRSWPPERKSPGVNQSQQTYVRNKISDIGKASLEHHKSDSQLKMNYSGEMKGKVKTLSSSFVSGIKERSHSVERLSSEQAKRRSDPTKDSIFPTVLNFSSPSTEKGVTVTKRITEEKIVAPTSKTNHKPTFNRLDSYPNKVRKSVRFSPSVDVAQYDLTSHLDTGAKSEEQSTQLTDQTENDKVNKSRNIEGVSDKNNLSIEFSKEQSENEVCLEIPESKGHGETSSNQELEVKDESSQEIRQTDVTVPHGDVDKVKASLDTHRFTETFNSSQVVEKHQVASEISQVIPGNSVNPFESEDPQAPQSSAERTTKEEAVLERDTNLLEKADSANDQENGSRQKKPVARANSLRGSAKQAEKTKVKLGSWSKGKSPLSKLFTSGGNDKKDEAKDAKKPDFKPGGGLLGRLFQSSSEKAEDATKSTAQDGRKDKTRDDEKEEVKEAVAKEMQKDFQVLSQDQEGGKHLKEKSNDAEPKNQAMSKSPELFKSTTRETTDDRTAPEQTHDQESNFRSNGLSVTDPEKAESKDLPITVQSVSQASKESISQLTTEKSGDEVLSAQFNNDILAPVASSDVQMNTDESAQKPDELCDADVEGRDLCGGALLDLNHENSSRLFDPEVSVDTPTDASSLSGTALSEAAFTDTFSLHDSPPMSTKNDAIHGLTDQLIVPDSATLNQDEDQTSVLSKAAPTDAFNLLDSPPTSAKNDTIHGPTDQLTVSDSATMNQDKDQTSALSEATPTDAFSLLDSPPTSAKNDTMLSLTDPLTVPVSTTMNQDMEQTSALSEAAPTDTFSLLDSSPMSAKNDTMLSLTDPLTVPVSTTMNQDMDQTSALSETAPTDTFSLLDSSPTSAKNDTMLGPTDPLIVPDSAIMNQDEDQTSNSQTTEQDADFDIFGSNNIMFTQSPAVPYQGGFDASSTQLSAFPDDIFGVSDVFTVTPSTSATSNSMNDLLGSDASSTAPPAQADLFADDIFASELQLPPVSEPSDVNLFVDSLLVSDNNSTQQAAGSDVTSSSWMNDLLG